MGQRNTKHKSLETVGNVTKPFRPEYAEQARKLCAAGFSEIEVADFFAVDLATYCRWEAEEEDFRNAVVLGSALADARVVGSLFRRAVGYTYEAVKIFRTRRDGAPPLIVPYEVHVPPDTKAAIYWIESRSRKSDRADASQQDRDHEPAEPWILQFLEKFVADHPAANLSVPGHLYPVGHPSHRPRGGAE